MQGMGKKASPSPGCVKLEEIAFDEVARYDRRHFGFQRGEFLRMWIQPTAGLALGVVREEGLVGYGVVRKCVEGYKIGPLFADNAAVASQLFAALGNHAAGQVLTLDVPEVNAGGMALARENGLKEVFGCARMYYGQGAAQLPWNHIYGLTTFELG